MHDYISLSITQQLQRFQGFRDAIVDALEDAGYTDVNVTVKNGSIDEVIAKDGKITITFNKAVEAADSQSELDRRS